jgi:hypothetical protein
MMITCFGISSTYRSIFLRLIKISSFGGISKFLKLIVFGQILAKFWQLWVDSCAIVVVNSMPSFEKKK